MPQANLSGYLAEQQAVTWASGRSLVSLAADEYTNLSDNVDNSSTKYLQADIEISVDWDTTAPTDGESLHLYIIPIPGTEPNWVGDGTANEPINEQYYAGSFTVTDILTSQVVTIEDIPLPSGNFKFAVRNKTSQPLTAAAHTLKWRPKSFGSQ